MVEEVFGAETFDAEFAGLQVDAGGEVGKEAPADVGGVRNADFPAGGEEAGAVEIVLMLWSAAVEQASPVPYG